MTSLAAGNGRDSRGAGDRDGRLLLDAVGLVQRALIAADGDGSERGGSGGPAPLHVDKVRCEAAMLLRAAAPLADCEPGLADALARLGAELAAQKTDELAVRLCLHPGVALDLALVPVHLRALELGEPSLEPLLDDLFGSDRLRGPERPANRELEQLWLLSLWSGKVEAAEVLRALSASSLAWEFDHLAGTTDDAYAFTHSILYATDHGRRRTALPRPAGEIEDDAEAILAVALDAGNHDVAAEVLWTWPMLGLPWTPLAAEARAFLSEVSGSSGFLPGPGFDLVAYEGLPFPERDLYVLRTSYHTTLVHGLLLAATARSEARCSSRAAAGRAGRIASLVAAVVPPRATPWWTWFAQLSVSRQDQLASALLAMALRRAVTAADLPAVQQAVSLAAECAILESPVTRQAGILLRRAAACAELAGVAVARG